MGEASEPKVKHRDGFIEWAVLQSAFRRPTVLKGNLGSKEEAEAWLSALKLTLRREDHDHFMATDGIISRGEFYVAWRRISFWRDGEEDPAS